MLPSIAHHHAHHHFSAMHLGKLAITCPSLFSKFAVAEVAHGLAKLGVGIHHKRTLARDWLVQRLNKHTHVEHIKHGSVSDEKESEWGKRSNADEEKGGRWDGGRMNDCE
jgi:hypothetical protein